MIDLPTDVKQWFYFPIEMPLAPSGMGPATIEEATSITYEVWDQYCDTHGSFEFLSDAINHAIKLNLERIDVV